MNRLMRMPVARPVVRGAGSGSPNSENPQSPPVCLAPPPTGCTTVPCDQAIFTSIRTPTGEGYRIVAHSPGVSYDERAELTRRSPSHGALSSPDPAALGLLAYRLASERFAVGHCAYAGAEHTARGGQRVWTHYAVLDTTTYAAFGFSPLRVQRAIAAAGAGATAPPPALPPLAVPAWARTDLPQPVASAADAEPLLRLIDACVRPGQFALSGIADAPVTLEWALELLPAACRRDVSLSWGLTFCLGRGVGVTLVDSTGASLDRLTRGHNVQVRNLENPTPLSAALAPWYDLIRAWTPGQRWSRIARYTARLTGGLDTDALARLAQISLDQDVADAADEHTKAALRDKYADFVPTGDIEAELMINLRAAIAPPPEPAEENGSSASGGVRIRTE